MANLRIQEYLGISRGNGNPAQAIAGPPLIEQTPIAIAGASAQSAVFGVKSHIICVQAEAICAVYVGGTNPVATAGTSQRLVAGQTAYFGVQPGEKLAVISDT